jgi:hypothetical protein
MTSIVIEPHILIPIEHVSEYDQLRQTLDAYSKTRDKYKIHSLNKQGFKDGDLLAAPVERGLMIKLSMEETVQQIDTALADIMDRLEDIAVLPMERLNIPIVGQDQVADRYLADKYASMQLKLEELDEDIRKTWDRPYGELYEDFKGISILELVSATQAVPVYINEPAFEYKNNALALTMDIILEAIPELGHIFKLGRKPLLLDSELETLKASILNKYPHPGIARKVSQYLDYWSTHGHTFIIKFID